MPQLLLIRWVQKGSPSERTHDFTTYVTGELSGGSVQKHVNEELDKFQKGFPKATKRNWDGRGALRIDENLRGCCGAKSRRYGSSDTACRTHVVAAEATVL